MTRPFALDLAYAGIGVAVWGLRSSRMLLASGLQVVITLGTGAALLLQRHVAEIEDGWKIPTGRPSGASASRSFYSVRPSSCSANGLR